MPLLSIIIPCFNNGLEIDDAVAALRRMEQDLPESVAVEYIFIDDKSKDDTYERLVDVHNGMHDRSAVIRLTRNVGVYNALLAAFEHVHGDCVTVFPADLQEPVELIPRMYGHWVAGARLVLTARTRRKDGTMERLTSLVFHLMMKRIAMPGIPLSGFGTALVDRSVMMELMRMREKNSNTLLLISWLGHQPVVIPYDRSGRSKGRSGWSLSKKVKLFVDSVVAFSYAPIRFITWAGFLFGLIAFTYAIVVLVSALTGGVAVQGWSALMIVVLMATAFQMVALGILGEYLWRTLDTVRQRPPYIIDRLHDTRRYKDAPGARGTHKGDPGTP
ncbi:MAG: glycosyltransferase [Flavobacteriales bacterium]|nr:glycosyltransferase [Flavobacteriales bacterium]